MLLVILFWCDISNTLNDISLRFSKYFSIFSSKFSNRLFINSLVIVFMLCIFIAAVSFLNTPSLSSSKSIENLLPNVFTGDVFISKVCFCILFSRDLRRISFITKSLFFDFFLPQSFIDLLLFLWKKLADLLKWLFLLVLQHPLHS